MPTICFFEIPANDIEKGENPENNYFAIWEPNESAK